MYRAGIRAPKARQRDLHQLASRRLLEVVVFREVHLYLHVSRRKAIAAPRGRDLHLKVDRRLLGTKRGHRIAITVAVTRGYLQEDRRKADAAARGRDLHLEVDRRLLGTKRGHRKATTVKVTRGDLQEDRREVDAALDFCYVGGLSLQAFRKPRGTLPGLF